MHIVHAFTVHNAVTASPFSDYSPLTTNVAAEAVPKSHNMQHYRHQRHPTTRHIIATESLRYIHLYGLNGPRKGGVWHSFPLLYHVNRRETTLRDLPRRLVAILIRVN